MTETMTSADAEKAPRAAAVLVAIVCAFADPGFTPRPVAAIDQTLTTRRVGAVVRPLAIHGGRSPASRQFLPSFDQEATP